MVSVRYDEEAKALYFQMIKGKVAETVSLGKDQFLDVSKNGKIIGLEVLLPNKIPVKAKKIILNA
jgi:uncharacterized protein YuzE